MTEENRYPFTSCYEFFASGYFLELGSLHLTLGFLFLAAFLVYLILSKKVTFLQSLSVFYFSASIYNNPAYNAFGLSFAESAGTLAAFLFFVSHYKNIRILANQVYSWLDLFLSAAFLHFLLINLLFPALYLGSGVDVIRFILFAKIFVLSLNLRILSPVFRSPESVKWFFAVVSYSALIASLVYLFQAFVSYTLVPTYGQYASPVSGFLGFGSVSIERGHYSKFLLQYLPFLTPFFLLKKRYLPLVIVYSTVLVNPSLSGLLLSLVFLILLSLIYLRSSPFFPLILLGFLVLTASAASHYLSPLVQKLITFTLAGDTKGGRTLSNLLPYISSYPLGIGYGGSTLRLIPGLPELNLGFLVLLSQLTILGLFLYLLLLIRVYSLSLSLIRLKELFASSLAAGIICSTITFASDVLWFLPLYWASYQISLHLLARNKFLYSIS